MQRVEVVVADLREEFRIVSELWHHEQATQSEEASLSIRQDIVCYLNRLVPRVLVPRSVMYQPTNS